MQPVGALGIVAHVHPVLAPLPRRAIRADHARDRLPVVTPQLAREALLPAEDPEGGAARHQGHQRRRLLVERVESRLD